MKEEITDFKHFVEENRIVITKKIRSHRMHATNLLKPAYDTVIKEIWGIENGIITLLEQIRVTNKSEHIERENLHELQNLVFTITGKELELKMGSNDDSKWSCQKCGELVDGRNVTFEEYHEGCGGRCI